MTSASDMVITRFIPEHFYALDLQPSQAYVRECTTLEHLVRLSEGGPCYSGIVDGHVMFCGGLKEYGPDRGVLWSFIDRRAGAHFVRLHRYVERFLEVVDRPLIQATCRTGFEAGARWLSMLGFEFVRPLGPYGAAGMPHDLYLRVH